MLHIAALLLSLCLWFIRPSLCTLCLFFGLDCVEQKQVTYFSILWWAASWRRTDGFDQVLHRDDALNSICMNKQCNR